MLFQVTFPDGRTLEVAGDEVEVGPSLVVTSAGAEYGRRRTSESDRTVERVLVTRIQLVPRDVSDLSEAADVERIERH